MSDSVGSVTAANALNLNGRCPFYVDLPKLMMGAIIGQKRTPNPDEIQFVVATASPGRFAVMSD